MSTRIRRLIIAFHLEPGLFCDVVHVLRDHVGLGLVLHVASNMLVKCYL
jgi:hypothetical protein